MRDPFKVSEPTCLSFSGGRTSGYMLRRFLDSNGGIPDGSFVTFANTGKEDEATLKFVKDCQDNWGIQIHWLEYRNDDVGYEVVNFETASRDGEPFEALIKKKQFLPNPVMRFCSHELKNKPIAKFCGLGDDATMVGVRADEPWRIPKMRARGLLIPLADAEIVKQNVRDFWKSQPFDLELPERDGLTNLGNCDLCFLKDFDVVMSNVKENPNRAVWWAKQEKRIGATFHKSRPTYQQMQDFATQQVDFIGYSETGIACFCGD